MKRARVLDNKEYVDQLKGISKTIDRLFLALALIFFTAAIIILIIAS